MVSVDYSIILAGLGRCGTTLVYKTLLNYFKEGDFVCDLKDKEFKNGYVYKTHDFAPEKLSGNVRVIFMFGNPLNITIATHKLKGEYLLGHYVHLHSKYLGEGKHITQDVIQLEKNFDSWYCKQTFPLLTLRYETLYDNLDTLIKFVGIDFEIEPKKERNTDWRTHPQNKILLNTYRKLLAKIKSAENIKIW